MDESHPSQGTKEGLTGSETQKEGARMFTASTANEVSFVTSGTPTTEYVRKVKPLYGPLKVS